MTWCSQARVGQDFGPGEPPFQRDPRRLELAGQAVRGGGRDLRQVASPQRQLEGGGLGGGKGLQVTDHAGQPQHLVPKGGQLARRGLRHAVEQRLVAGLQDRDRGPQLVGDVGDQSPAQLLLPVKRVGHLVEGGRQLAQLTRCRDLPDPGGAVAPAHRPGRRDQLPHRPGDPPGHGQPRQQRQHRRQPGRPGYRPQERRLQGVVRGSEAGAGEPHHGSADRRAAHDDGGPALRAGGALGEAAGDGDGPAGLVPYLRVRAHPCRQVQHGLHVGRCPAVVAVPRRPGRRRDRLGQLRALPAGQAGDIGGRERCRQPGQQRDGGQRHRGERQRQPQPDRITPGNGIRRTGAAVSHRPPGRAGSRRPARSG